MNVTVYTLPDCTQCVATKKILSRTGLDYRAASLQEHPHALAYAQEQGWNAAPVVMVHDVVGQLVAAWSGLRPDKIKAVAQHREEKVSV